jgi:bacillithiol system protein YtxJ
MSIIRSAPDLDAAWASRFAAHDVAVLYKHSPTCGLSAMALDEVRAFADAHPDVPVYLVDVFAQRPLSNAVEESLGIRHESPQAIVFRGGAPVWHGSHRRVARAALATAVTGAEAPDT